MLCGVISDLKQLENIPQYCSLVELRLDLLNKVEDVSLPKIFTLRNQEQGGTFSGTEEERMAQIEKLAKLEPEYLDLEYTLPPAFIQKIRQISPNTKIIASYHDFEKMPSPEKVLKKMEPLQADFYKMAFMLHTSSEALSLLLFMRAHEGKVIAMGMNLYGEATRILAPIFGAKLVYASTGEATTPGQLPAKTLEKLYHFNALSPTTKIYGLIGDPIDKSPSHFTHNFALDKDCVYLKFPVSQSDLEPFLSLAIKMGISGLSVTMPLKEKVIPFLDTIDPEAKKIGAVNTLRFQDGKITGFNTDGKGALDAIEEKMKVKGKKIVFIGAGGASKALVFEAINRGAEVTIVNRHADRAAALAEKMGCTGGSLDQIPKDYQIIVNTTPSDMPITSDAILPKTLAMNLKNKPLKPKFLLEAEKKRCTLIFGYEMFINQALEQFKIWQGKEFNLEKARKILQQRVETYYGK